MTQTAQLQLDFISYLQRLLVEGDFSATYKFALLHAIADCCVELPDPGLTPVALPLPLLAEKLLQLYWHHAVPFGETQGEAAVLKQNAGKQAAIISQLYQCQQANIRTLNQLKNSPYWSDAYTQAMVTLKDGPLWRLQILSKQAECFLYPHHKPQAKSITLNPGIAHCFRRFYDLVVHLARSGWLEKIQAIKSNQALLGNQSQLQQFLFGSDRSALGYARPVLMEVQKNRCFYCQQPLKSQGEVDHFIPFARYANDLGHNFVLAHSACNNNKRDYLAAPRHRERWLTQNLDSHRATIHEALSPYVLCNAEQSLAVANWAYDIATSTHAKLWSAIEQFEDFPTATSGTTPTRSVTATVQHAIPVGSLESV